MPDTRTNRGAHPKDGECFDPRALPALQAAVGDLCWLLSRGYPKAASLKLVGDRFALLKRQRIALQRCAAGDEECIKRRQSQVGLVELDGEELFIDGYNVLLTVEVALSGGVVLRARDGTLRDMASISGQYRKVRQTVPALELIGRLLAAASCQRAVWFLDRPVSNSGRLKGVIAGVAREHGWPWGVELVASPDRRLAAAERIIATADSAVLDRCQRWFNLARYVVEGSVPEPWIVDLSQGPPRSNH